MIRRPPRSTQSRSSAASDVYKRQIEGRVFSHGTLDCGKCHIPHIGWDPQYSPFLTKDSSPENPPSYYKWLDSRFRHHTICGGRGCLRKQAAATAADRVV